MSVTERNQKMAGRRREGERKKEKKNQNENRTRRGNNGIRVHEHACSALISRGYYRASIVWRKNNGGGGKGWMTDAGKNRETGKGGADRPLFFVETRNRGRLNNRGNRLSGRGGVLCFWKPAWTWKLRARRLVF